MITGEKYDIENEMDIREHSSELEYEQDESGIVSGAIWHLQHTDVVFSGFIAGLFAAKVLPLRVFVSKRVVLPPRGTSHFVGFFLQR